MARRTIHSILISKCKDMIIKRTSAMGVVKEYERLAKEDDENAELYNQHAEHYRRMV